MNKQPVIGALVKHPLALGFLPRNLQHLSPQILALSPHNIPQPLNFLRRRFPLDQRRLPSLGRAQSLLHRHLLLPPTTSSSTPTLLFPQIHRIATIGGGTAATAAVNRDVSMDVLNRLLRLDAREEEIPDGDHVAAANLAERVDGGQL